MSNYIGAAYGFVINEQLAGSDYLLTVTFSSAPATANVYQVQHRVIGAGSWTSAAPIYMNNPGTLNVPVGNNEYRVQLFFSGGAPFEYIAFAKQVISNNNFLYIPKANPLVFTPKNQIVSPKYHTRHFEENKFSIRKERWHEPEKFCQPWQKTDIHFLQVESSFAPILYELLNEHGHPVIQRAATATIPHANIPNLYVYEFSISLAGLANGCYKARLTAGSGIYQQIYETEELYIADYIPNTILFEYSDSKDVHRDVMYKTGFRFQYRAYANIGLIDPQRADEYWRDQAYSNNLLNSKIYYHYPLTCGRTNFGMTEEEIVIMHEIFSCDSVAADNKYFALAAGSKVEYIPVARSRKRFMQAIIEESLNRNSRVYQTVLDAQKRLLVTGTVSPKVWGVQNGSNVINVTNIE